MNYLKYGRFHGLTILWMFIYSIIFIWNALYYYPAITCKISSSFWWWLLVLMPFAAYILLIVALGYQMFSLNSSKLSKDYKLSPQQRQDVINHYYKRQKTTNNLIIASNVLNIPMFIFVLITWFIWIRSWFGYRYVDLTRNCVY